MNECNTKRLSDVLGHQQFINILEDIKNLNNKTEVYRSIDTLTEFLCNIDNHNIKKHKIFIHENHIRLIYSSDNKDCIFTFFTDYISVEYENIAYEKMSFLDAAQFLRDIIRK